MIKCLAIDDEPLALDILSTFCKKISNVDLVARFTNLDKAKEFIQNHEIDLLFLDIQMPDMNGVDFYKQFASNKLVIFTTAFSEFATEGFNVNAIDYLVKPFDFNRFLIACKKVSDTIHLKLNSKKIIVSIKSDSKIFNIEENEITHIESKDDYVKIFLIEGKHILSKITTKGVLEILSDDFIRIHRSYIINKNHVRHISTTTLNVAGFNLPIGKNYKEELSKIFI